MSAPALIAKIILLLLAVVTTAVGLYSHFNSDWVKEVDLGYDTVAVYVYEVCNNWPNPHDSNEIRNLACPHISMERYFVAMVIICLIWALATLVVACVVGDNPGIKWADGAINILVAILLLIAAIVYIVDTEQIKTLSQAQPPPKFPLSQYSRLQHSEIPEGFELLEGARISATVVAILQSIFHVIVAALVFKSVNQIQKDITIPVYASN